MNRILFICAFIIYIAINGIISLLKLSQGHIWFNQWVFDKYYVFQFMSVVTIGLSLESGRFNQLTHIRIGNRRKILKEELQGYYSLGLICLFIMFVFIMCGALILKESNFILKLTDWFFRYLLGIIIFVNIMSCLRCSSNIFIKKHAALIVFLFMAIELIALRPYIRKFYSIDLGLIFSWIFHNHFASYYWMISIVFITLLLNIKSNEKRDFI